MKTAGTRALLALALCGLLLPRVTQAEQRPLFDLRGHRTAVLQVVFDPKRPALASIGHDRKILVWNLERHTLARRIAPVGRSAAAGGSLLAVPRTIEGIGFLPNGELGELAVEGGVGTVRLWNTLNGSEIRTIASDDRGSRALAFSPDGAIVATTAADGSQFNQKIILRNVSDGRVLHELRSARLSATRLTFSPDGALLLSAGGKRMNLWNVADGTMLHQIGTHKKTIQAITFAPDGKSFASAGDGDLIRIWNPTSGTLLRDFEAEQDGVNALAYSPDGGRLASAGDDWTTRIWNPETKKLLKRLRGHTERVLTVAYSPDGKFLATGSRDTTISIWSVADFEK